jgi:hypothetical protein
MTKSRHRLRPHPGRHRVKPGQPSGFHFQGAWRTFQWLTGGQRGVRKEARDELYPPQQYISGWAWPV